MNRSASAVTVRCAQATGRRDDPSLTLGQTCDDPLRSALTGGDDPAVTRPGPVAGQAGAVTIGSSV
jgi:hypothetical protein